MELRLPTSSTKIMHLVVASFTVPATPFEIRHVEDITYTRGTGGWARVFSLPPVTIAPDEIALQIGAGLLVLEHVDTTTDAYDVVIDVAIFGDQSNWLLLRATPFLTGDSADDGVTLAASDLTLNDSAGSDLAYVGETGAVTTTSGGSFSTVIQVRGDWD